MFLNACRTDGQAPLYTTVEGWAASFLRAGAGAFIGSLWEVVDTSASTYAQEFYRAALAGHTLGSRHARPATPSATTPATPPGSPTPSTATPQQQSALSPRIRTETAHGLPAASQSSELRA